MLQKPICVCYRILRLCLRVMYASARCSTIVWHEFTRAGMSARVCVPVRVLTRTCLCMLLLRLMVLFSADGDDSDLVDVGNVNYDMDADAND